MADYRNLEVWRLAREMTLATYRVTTSLPAAERYALTAQIRRSAASVAANIAEGAGRESDPDFARFIAIALSSANETECHASLAYDLGYIDSAAHEQLIELISRTRSMLTKLHKTLKS